MDEGNHRPLLAGMFGYEASPTLRTWDALLRFLLLSSLELDRDDATPVHSMCCSNESLRSAGSDCHQHAFLRDTSRREVAPSKALTH